jgi:hypothetical protein
VGGLTFGGGFFGQYSQGGTQPVPPAGPYATLALVGTYAPSFELVGTVRWANTYAETVLQDSPTAYWRLGDLSGLSLLDATGHGHTITLASTVGVSFGVAGALAEGGQGLALSGITGYRGTFAPIVTGTTFSIEFWFTPNGDAGSDTYQMVISQGAGGPWLYWMDSGAAAPNGKKLNLYYAGLNHAPGSVLVDGTRYHVVLSVTAGVGQFYINGVADGATMSGVPSMSLDTVFAYVDGTEWLKASMFDELAVYPTALSPARVAAHYANGRGIRALPITATYVPTTTFTGTVQ